MIRMTDEKYVFPVGINEYFMKLHPFQKRSTRIREQTKWSAWIILRNRPKKGQHGFEKDKIRQHGSRNGYKRLTWITDWHKTGQRGLENREKKVNRTQGTNQKKVNMDQGIERKGQHRLGNRHKRLN